MANTSAPIGLVPMGNAGGAAANYELATTSGLLISKSDATKVFRGDPLKRLSTGYLAQWTAGTSAALLAGVFAGCKYYSTSQQKIIFNPYWPGSDATNDPIVYMYPITGTIAPRFWIQSSGTAIAFADENANADVTLATAGNTTTGFSGCMLDQSTIATTSTLPFKIVDQYSNFQNYGNGTDNTTSFNRVIVIANVGVTVGV